VACDAEASPAAVPSVFHQRIEYLGLDFLRSLLVALLRLASSPTWLSCAATRGGSAAQVPVPATTPGVWSSMPSTMGLRTGVGGLCLGPADACSTAPQRIWATVMDFALEGARRVVDIMETLQSQRQANLLLFAGSRRGRHGSEGGAPDLQISAVADAAMSASSMWIPLSLALATLEPLGGAEVEGPPAVVPLGGSALSSPGGLARGLTPPVTPSSPSRLATGLSPPMSPAGPTSRSSHERKAGNGGPRRGLSYRHAALRPFCCMGGQLVTGIVPEYVSFPDQRKLCSSILEMACTLLCHFCQATRSGILVGVERSAPGAAVLHGLLSFLHELRTSALLGTLGIDAEYLTELDSMLRSSQNLCTPEGEQQHLNPAFDGDAWMPPGMAGVD